MNKFGNKTSSLISTTLISISENSLTTTESSTTLTILSYSLVLSCVNGGTFNIETCLCSCYPSYSGNFFKQSNIYIISLL